MFAFAIFAFYLLISGSKSLTSAVEYQNENATKILLNNQLQYSSILYGLTEISDKKLVADLCLEHLKKMKLAILQKQPWAMKALDASGRTPPGFILTNDYWFGSKDSCAAIHHPIGITLSTNLKRFMHYELLDTAAPFDVEFRVAVLKHESPWQIDMKYFEQFILHIGLCLPTSCNQQDLMSLIEKYVESDLFPDVYETKPKPLYVKNLKVGEDFYQRRSYKIFLAFVAFTFVMTILSTYLRNKIFSESSTSKIAAFMDCYNLKKNLKELLHLREYKSYEIKVLNGIRTIGAAGISIYHVFLYGWRFISNKATLFAGVENIQPFFLVYWGVDCFFTLGGFMQIYIFLADAKKVETVRQNSLIKNILLLGEMFIKRYIRFFPYNLFMVLMTDLLFSYLQNVSLFHIREDYDDVCFKYGWDNLLNMVNFNDYSKMCADWTWYMACDMQCFTVISVLIVIYIRYPKEGKILNALFLLLVIIYSYIIGIHYELQMTYDTSYVSATQFYFSPAVRCLPYMIGAFAAIYYMEGAIKRPEAIVLSSTFSLIVFVFIFIKIRMATLYSYFAAVSLLLLARILFAISIVSIIIGSGLKSKGWWSFGEAKIFQHFGQVTLGVYLLSPPIVHYFFSMWNEGVNINLHSALIYISGLLLMKYLAAVVFTLFYNMPMDKITNLILTKSRKPKST